MPKSRNLSVSLLTATLLLGLSTASFSAGADMPPTPKGQVTKAGEPWWKHAVFYEIYPRSFADSNGDGIGDINGITSKLDYLHNLGVDAIWITPCYPSPQVDFGYDISDYCNIAPEYGTLADFDRLIAEAKKRNIRIVMDFVLNHTSDEHPWFQASKSSRNNPKRDWYIWRDGKPDGGPPNNWLSIFGHSAWQLDKTTHQYYYHFFYPEQPDLNWRNHEVRKAMYNVVRFWLNRGVSGFRLDAVGCLFEDPNLHDNPVLPGTNGFGDPNMENKFNDQYPEVHEVMQELRLVLDSYPDNPVLIGETSGSDVPKISLWYGTNLDEIQLPMNFIVAYLNKLSASQFRKTIGEWDANPIHGWPLYFFSNHDQMRHYLRYGDGVHNDAIAKVMAALLLTVRGTPLLYYGEELGMENNDPQRIEDVYDPIGKIGWPKVKGRDGERTPMQWDAGKNAGFTTGKPWLQPPESFVTHNVSTELKSENSILRFYQKLIEIRREDPFRNGIYAPINIVDPNVLAYTRTGHGTTGMVILNMSDKEQVFKPLLPGKTFSTDNLKTLLTSDPTGAHFVGKDGIKLPPFGVVIATVQ